MADIKFYGTRGSYSLTSEKYMEFGGATTCIVIRFDETTLMVDCGSGVLNALEDLNNVNELHLFITHSHIDHIDGMVSLLPAFKDKKLHIYSKSYGDVTVEDSLNRITSQSLWPIKADAYKNVIFHNIDGEFELNGITVSNMDSNHTDGCTLFRFRNIDDDITTAFDFCHLNGYDSKLIEFAKGTKTLIYDGCLSEKELSERPDWGHSTPEAGAKIGETLGVEQLYITHHGVRDDDTLSEWERNLKDKYPFLVFARSGHHKSELLKMIDIGSLLYLEKDNDNLLFKIVEATMDIASADGGTIYLLKDDCLEFKVMINRSMNTRLIRKEKELSIPPVMLSGKNICAESARTKRLLSIPDCYNENRYDLSGVKKYDELNNYHTQSVIAVPLIDDNDDLIGVLQLINAKDNSGKVVPFKKHDEEVILSIANQAAMSIVKTSYSEKIDNLLYGFVKVMSLGIDERTPYNASHTKNMVAYAERFFNYEDETNGKYKVDKNERREILMSIWLHDIGKLLIPLDTMNKDSRLGSLINGVEARFDRRDLLLRLELSQNLLSQEEYDKKQEERLQQFNFVRLANLVGFLSDDTRARLDELAKMTYRELDGTNLPVITKEEYYQLATNRGTLTKEERAVMESHVVMTQRLLSQLEFPKNYRNIFAYAGNHHEFMDGSGYPNHLKAQDLPWPCRFITILDIFEAITAKDRPYKKPETPEKAFGVLKDMANAGKLDNDIIEEYRKAWMNNRG